MTATTPRRILHLVVAGLSPERMDELQKSVARPGAAKVEIMSLNETNGPEALERIFAADTVAVWGEIVENG